MPKQAFDRIVVVNLKHRTDRLQEMKEELAKVQLKSNEGEAKFFEARSFNDAKSWPSKGALGCFMSHYDIIKQADHDNLGSILILEDDCSFNPKWKSEYPKLCLLLENSPWDIVYIGHIIDGAPPLSLKPAPVEVITCHCYALHKNAFKPLLQFLERVQLRAPGDPLGGPMHFDGALNMFRAQHPEIKGWITLPSLADQRSSKSDINAKWFDNLPILSAPLRWARSLKKLFEK